MDDVATLDPPNLRLDDGVELLGQYQGSGLREAPYLIRRPDGQVIQVSHLIYLVATSLRPDDDLGRVAASVSDDYGQPVTADNVAYLIAKELAPAGIVRRPATEASGDRAEGAHAADARDGVGRAKPLLALRMRVPLVPARAHRVVTRALVPLFRLPIVLAALVGLVAVDVWLAQSGEALAWGLRGIIYQPQLLLMVTLITFAAAAFHELGHAAAARRGGAHPGAMGAGIYLVWPVFYTDVSDSYRLSRRGRLRTDLGGVYFNVVFALGLTGAYFLTGFEPLLVSVVLTQIETLRQFLPFVRLDGYYVVSDLAGVPNLFTYMRPVLVGLLRRRDDAVRRAARAQLRELRPGARALIIGWVAITTPVLLVNLVVLLVVAPRLAGAAWGSAGGQLRAMAGPDGLDPIRVANSLVGIMLLALPVMGIGYIAFRFVGRVVVLARTWWTNRPLPTAVALAAVTLVVVLQVGLVWPDSFTSALRRAQESPTVDDAPHHIAGPPVRPRPAPELAAPPAPPTTPAAPPTAPSTTSGRGRGSSSDGSGARRGGDTSTSTASTATAAPSTSTTAPTTTTRETRPTSTTTTTAPTTSTTAPEPDDPLSALLAELFPPTS